MDNLRLLSAPTLSIGANDPAQPSCLLLPKRQVIVGADMTTTGDRRHWFGLGARPRLPSYLRAGGPKRFRPPIDKGERIKLKPGRGKRLKGLNEFERPEFVGRMARVERRQKVGWWGLMLAAFAVGGAIGWFLI